jgi:hypothetical protein
MLHIEERQQVVHSIYKRCEYIPLSSAWTLAVFCGMHVGHAWNHPLFLCDMQGGHAYRHGLLLRFGINEESARVARGAFGGGSQQSFSRPQRSFVCQLQCSSIWRACRHVVCRCQSQVRFKYAYHVFLLSLSRCKNDFVLRVWVDRIRRFSFCRFNSHT